MMTNLFWKKNLKLRLKPQEIMKLYYNLNEYQPQLINLEKENEEHSYTLYLNFREKSTLYQKNFVIIYFKC